ncbi:hypothetical protein Bca4012_068071 [Brassica carinata]
MNFQIIAVAVIRILATALFLVTCYVFVNKCWRRNDILDRVSSSGGLSDNHDDDHIMFYSPEFRTSGEGEEKISQQCSACMNEFHVNETVRVVPHYFHLFHIRLLIRGKDGYEIIEIIEMGIWNGNSSSNDGDGPSSLF